MTNKLYQQSREEAWKQTISEIKGTKHSHDSIYAHLRADQLTAEIYGMKLLEMSQPDDTNDIWFMRTTNNNWTNSETYDDIGTTQQLHNHFVEQFNKQQP